VNFDLFFWEQHFPQRISCTTFFCWSATKFGRIRSLANQNVFPEFRELWSGGPAGSRGIMHQSFTDTLVKWFLPMHFFADSVVSIHCIARGLCRRKLSVQLLRISWWFPATARPSCFSVCYYKLLSLTHCDKQLDRF